PEHRASDASVLMLAWRSVWTATGSEFEFALVGVLVEVGPFLIRWFTVFGFGTNASAIVKE
ncbi:MAG TPA: hypothetical protein VIJ23_20630, partial [Mycobacterium sp.]